jgi:hypothetical protein
MAQGTATTATPAAAVHASQTRLLHVHAAAKACFHTAQPQTLGFKKGAMSFFNHTIMHNGYRVVSQT